MKKVVLNVLLFAFFFASACFGAVQYSTQEELKKIADDVQKCIDENYMTDYSMAQCTIEGTKRYNAEIEKTVNAAKDLLSKEQYEQFLKTQKKWEEFMKEKDNLLKQTYEKNCPPYLPCLVAAGDRYHFVKARAEDLSGFCGLLILFSDKGVLDDNLNFVEFKY